MAEDKFKLPRSSYEELCKIIRAYGRMGKPSSLEEIASYCAIGKTVISANNAFLSNVDLINGGKAKQATESGQSIAQALEHEIPEQIQESWAKVVNSSEFLEKMAAAVKIRGKMESSALESHIAYSAGETKSRPVMTGARAVLDILRAAGVVREHEGQLIASENGPVVTRLGAVTDSNDPATPAKQDQILRTIPITNQICDPSLRIELRIDAKPSELDGLGEKIRKLVKEIEGPPKVETDEVAKD